MHKILMNIEIVQIKMKFLKRKILLMNTLNYHLNKINSIDFYEARLKTAI